MKRKTALVAVACGSLLLPAVLATPAWADDDPVLVTGTVDTPSGAADAGASVFLIAEPTPDALAAMQLGDVVNTPIVAATTTSSSGSYTFDDPSSVPAGTTDDGVVNYQVLTAGQGDGAYAFSDEAPDATTDASFSREAHALSVGRSVAHTVNIREHLKKGGKTLKPFETVEPDKGGNCATAYVKDYGNQSTTVARAYSTTDDAQVAISYTAGASSSLGVGVSASAGGTFSASGTKTVDVTSSDESDMPGDTHKFSDAFNTDFDYREYDHYCAVLGKVTHSYEAEAVSHSGGARIANLSSTPTTPSGNNCDAYGKGGAEHVSDKSATTFSGGVNISKWIGVSLSAHTGYSTELKATMTAKYGAMDICGTSGPPSNPGMYFAKG